MVRKKRDRKKKRQNTGSEKSWRRERGKRKECAHWPFLLVSWILVVKGWAMVSLLLLFSLSLTHSLSPLSLSWRTVSQVDWSLMRSVHRQQQLILANRRFFLQDQFSLSSEHFNAVFPVSLNECRVCMLLASFSAVEKASVLQWSAVVAVFLDTCIFFTLAFSFTRSLL